MDDKLNDGVRTKTHTDRKERSKRRILGFVAVAALIAAIGVAGFNALRGRNSGGATLGGYDDMSREEIQDELDRQVEESMMTISLDMTPTLSADGTKLGVRVANVDENRFDQLIEVEQGGEVVGSHKGLKPGEKLDEIEVSGMEAGPAVVTVSALDADGGVHGNPSQFEVVWDLERKLIGSQYTSRVHATVPPFT